MDNIFDRWKHSFSALKTVCQQLEIIVPLAKEKQPIMLGNAFWCRRQALLPLGKVLGKKSYLRGKLGGDVLEEAMARIIPFAAQQAGFYSAGIMNPRQAIIEARNSKYMLEILAANAQ
jgi:lipopolysaccharide biosynthesis protein